jgi:hypothetical protein
MLQRIYNAIGMEPIGSGDNSSGQTFLTFSRELTNPEKNLVDSIMASNPTFPPSPVGTRFVVADIWNKKAQFEAAIGLSYDIYYSESVPGSGDVDTIELHFKKSLNLTEKARVATEYGKLLIQR